MKREVWIVIFFFFSSEFILILEEAETSFGLVTGSFSF